MPDLLPPSPHSALFPQSPLILSAKWEGQENSIRRMEECADKKMLECFLRFESPSFQYIEVHSCVMQEGEWDDLASAAEAKQEGHIDLRAEPRK